MRKRELTPTDVVSFSSFFLQVSTDEVIYNNKVSRILTI